MILLVVIDCIFIYFTRVVKHHTKESPLKISYGEKVGAGIALGLWIIMIALGRLIAYV
jgi:hypothetical protein